MPPPSALIGLACLLLSAALPRPASAAAEAPADPAAVVASLAESARSRWDAAGVAVVVVRSGIERDVAVGVGHVEVDARLPMTPDTRLPLGDAGSAFTAAVAARLVDRGLLDWDEPVARMLPAPLLPDPESASRISLRDLLLHRTGLGPVEPPESGRSPGPEALLRVAGGWPPAAPFRSAYVFSRVNLIAAEAVMARATGVPWPRLLALELLAPLGLADPPPEGERDPPAPSGRTLDREPSPSAPGAALEMSLRDLALWFRAALGDGPPLLGEDARRQLLTPGPALPGGPDEAPVAVAVAGGLAQPYRGRRLYWHDGVTERSAAVLMVLPDDRLAVAVLASSAPPELAVALARQVLDVAFGLEPERWHERPPADLAGPSTRRARSARSAPRPPPEPVP